MVCLTCEQLGVTCGWGNYKSSETQVTAVAEEYVSKQHTTGYYFFKLETTIFQLQYLSQSDRQDEALFSAQINLHSHATIRMLEVENLQGIYFQSKFCVITNW
jgi:hypothetical protein